MSSDNNNTPTISNKTKLENKPKNPFATKNESIPQSKAMLKAPELDLSKLSMEELQQKRKES